MFMIKLPKSLEKLYNEISKSDRIFIYIRNGRSSIALKSDIDKLKPCLGQSANPSVSCRNNACNFISTITYGGGILYEWKDSKMIVVDPESIPIIKQKAALAVCDATTVSKDFCYTCGLSIPFKYLNSPRTCPSCLINNILYCTSCGESGFFSVLLGTGANASKDVIIKATAKIPSQRNPEKPEIVQLHVCSSCFKKIPRCVKCDHCVLDESLYAMVGEQCFCTRCYSVINDYTFRPNPVFQSLKTEVTPNVFFGLELEVEMKRPFGKFTDIVARGFHDDVKSVAYLKRDASISNGFEIVSHPGTLKWWNDKNNPLITPIRKLVATCESWSSETCGIHVHMSNDAFNSSTHKATFAYFMTAFPLFTSFIAERYNAKQSPFNSMYVRSNEYAAAPDRHTAINFATPSQRTTEVRVFKGNLKWQRILKNIQYVDAVTQYTLNAKRKDLSVAGFLEFVNKNAKDYQELQLFAKDYKKAI